MREIPKVSIIVPNYNHGAYLRKRIDSVLNQTFQDFELILLDDCSTDNSVDILESYNTEARISHIEINKKNPGKPFQQWVRGIELAKGKYIWIAESDDYADNDFLEKTVAQLGCLKTQLGINYISYQKGRIYRSWNKHVRRRKI